MGTPALSATYDPAPWSPSEDFAWSFAPFGEGRMGKVNPFYFMQIGDRLGNFRRVFMEPGVTYALLHPETTAIEGALKRLLENPFVPAGLEETQKCALQIQTEWRRISAKYYSRAYEPIEHGDLLPLRLYFTTFEGVLHADLERLIIWHAPDQLGYGSGTLMGTPWNLFGELSADIRALAERELVEFGRAFVFDSGTAAAFHILRACELVMIEYCRVCGETPGTSDWGGYISALKRVRDLPPRLGQRLDAVRKYDRNEIMHPVGRFLSIDEAGDILDALKVLIKEMLRDVRQRRARADGGS